MQYHLSISTIWVHVVFNLPENRCRFTQNTKLLCYIYQAYTNRRKYFSNNKSTTKEWRLFWHLCVRIRFAFWDRRDGDSCENIFVMSLENTRVQHLHSTDKTRLEYQITDLTCTKWAAFEKGVWWWVKGFIWNTFKPLQMRPTWLKYKSEIFCKLLAGQTMRKEDRQVRILFENSNS